MKIACIRGVLFLVNKDGCGGFPSRGHIFGEKTVAKHFGKEFAFGVEEAEVSVFEAVIAWAGVGHGT